MNTRAKSAVIGGLAVLSTIGIATIANAAPKPLCQQYAQSATIQFNRMQQLNLGCSGFRWHNWYDGHYQWCRKVSLSQARAEAVVRDRTINFGGSC